MRELCWHAVTVRHQHERLVATALELGGVQTFVPVYRARRRWSDRVKEIDAPLFPGYVLGRFAMPDRLKVMRTPGVVRIVGFGGVPARIGDGEIDNVRRAVESKLKLGPCPHLRAGDRVRVAEGPLRGVEGTLLREKGAIRLVIGIELLQRSLAVELEREMVMSAGVGGRL
ncbi:MAG TPA: transcription termination/antitermination NusG family protein [Bryobacteraceae bacterium]|jgi:transcription antitermination factor NusG